MVVAPDRARVRWSMALMLPAFASLLACGAGRSGGGASPNAPLAGARAFGDTSAYGLRLLSLDAVDESARVWLTRPAHLIVLGVRPGREIELISHGTHRQGAVNLSMRRFEEASPDAARDADIRATLEYDRCIAAADRAAQERVRQRTQRRDSTGKVISTGGDPLPVPNYSACRKPSQTPAKPRRLAAREPAERYLVVLASVEPLPTTLLDERLGTLTAVASDVATTIEAIAAGLYVGIPAFAGTYVSWH